MALTEQEVETFLAAGKRVTARAMGWKGLGRDMMRWTAPIELGAVNVGSLDLLVHRSLPRQWTFKVLQGGEELLQWHFKPKGTPSRHKNPPGCPATFPANVTATEQEHRWAPGTSCKCARGLPQSVRDLTDHRAALTRFCEHARIELVTPYEPPPTGEQLSII